MRRSKYLNRKFGNWECTYVGISNVQGLRSKRPGNRNYFYIFERKTSDGLANKIIRLNSSEVSKVWRGIKCVEEILDNRERSRNNLYTRQIHYHFN